jgi:hypothetical protein
MDRRRTVALAIVALGVLLVSCATTQTAWKSAVQKNTLAGYDDFLAKYDKGAYSDSARLAIERLDYAAAEKENNVAAYQAFLQKHPGGKLAGTAKSQIEELTFRAAVAANSVPALKRFLQMYPASAEADAARAAIERIKLQSLQGELAFTEAVLKSHPEAAARGAIPGKYVGRWVHREDGVASEYLIVTGGAVIWKKLNGMDEGEKVFKAKDVKVTRGGLKLTADVVYSVEPGPGNRYSVPVPVTLTVGPDGLAVETAEAKASVPSDAFRDWGEGQLSETGSGSVFTVPGKQLIFSKAGA